MNDLDLERLGRAAAADINAQARLTADTRSALEATLAGRSDTTVSDLDLELSSVPDLGRSSRRTRWPALSAAAAVAVGIAGIALIQRDGDQAMVVGGNPATSNAPSEPAVQPSTDSVDESSPAPGDTTSSNGSSDSPIAEPVITDPPPDTAPETATDSTPPTAPPTIPAGPVTIEDVIGDPLARTVLATYDEGAGDRQLGFEDCTECDPVRPFAPVVTGDGTILIADAFNHRWQVIRDGTWQSRPYRSGEIVIAAPLVGPDGLVYAMVADDLPGRSGVHVVGYDPATLEVAESYDGGDPDYFALELVDGAIRTGSEQIVTFDRPLGTPTWQVDVSTQVVTISLSGVAIEFHLPKDWVPIYGALALPDGSVTMRVIAAQEDADAELVSDSFLLRMWTDGAWSTGRESAVSVAADEMSRFTDAGFVKLEAGEIARYDLPERPAS